MCIRDRHVLVRPRGRAAQRAVHVVLQLDDGAPDLLDVRARRTPAGAAARALVPPDLDLQPDEVLADVGRALLELARPRVLRVEVGQALVEVGERVLQALQVAGGGAARGPAGRLRGSDRRQVCLLYTSPSPRDRTRSRMPSSA